MTDHENKYDQIVFEVDEYVVHIYFETAGPLFRQIDEARQRGEIPLGGQYSANNHAAHVTGGKRHLHFYAGQKEIAAANFDGTGHDGYSGTKLPNKVASAISRKFPMFSLPPNHILESVPTAVNLLLQMQFKFKLGE